MVCPVPRYSYNGFIYLFSHVLIFLELLEHENTLCSRIDHYLCLDDEWQLFVLSRLTTHHPGTNSDQFWNIMCSHVLIILENENMRK